MSLKAKLEAVIYAAEEPVTLAQLAILFADEALDWKSEQEAARAAASEPEPVNEVFDYFEAGTVGETEPAGGTAAPDPTCAEPPIPEPAATAAEAGTVRESEPGPERTAEESSETASEPELDVVAEARRAARQRDREVRSILRALLDEIIASYAADSRGIEIREIAGGYRMATKPEFHDSVRAFIKSQKPALKLSLAALETLAVIAYKQPVTAPEVNEIRGVDASGVFGSLLARKLIATAGRKPVVGRPILYKTTKEFLLRFGLKELSELPSMEEFEKLAASELDDAGPRPPQSAPAAEIAAAEDIAADAAEHAAAAEDTEETGSQPNPSETAPDAE